MSIEIRKAESSEARALTEIAFAAKRRWGYPEEWIALWADQLTVDAGYVEANQVFLAQDDGRILGWCALLESKGECWVEHCWVLPEAAGRGIGERLMRRAFDLAAERRAAALKVISDPNAEGFYRKLGFRRIGEHPSVPRGRRLPVLQAIVR